MAIDIMPRAYSSLDHFHSLFPHVYDDLWYVHLSLFGGLSQSCVNGYQCPRSTYSSTACVEQAVNAIF